jgi:hypothetical protein
LAPKDETDRLSQNVGNKLRIYAAWNPKNSADLILHRCGSLKSPMLED